jgi:hypothetical protein
LIEQIVVPAALEVLLTRKIVRTRFASTRG